MNEKVSRLTDKGVIKDASEGLIYLFLSSKFGLDEHTITDCLTDGGNDLGVDAIYINRVAQRPEIHVIQSKFHSSQRKASNAFKISDVKKFRDFLLAVKDLETNLEKLTNEVLRAKIYDVRELFEQQFPVLRLWCLSNGRSCVRHQADAFSSELEQFDATLEEFHLVEFYNFCVVSRSKRLDHSFWTKSSEVIEYNSGAVGGVHGLISAEQLYHIIKDITEPTSLDFGLFDLNIRGFLGSDNQINRQIYRSAVAEDNSRFWCLNNGITMTCSKSEISHMSHSPKVAVKDLRIVNGAQTCGAIFKAVNDFDLDWKKFRNLAVSFRLYETTDPDFVDDIAISSNSQNRVNSRDLKANHSYQLHLEQELETHGIRYLRKRGITQEYENLKDDDSTPDTIDALKVGQIILSYIMKQPERAKRDSDIIFDSLYERIFGSVDVIELHFAINLYWKIMGKRAFIEDEIRIRGRSNIDHDFITYGVFHVLYACRILMMRDSELQCDQDELVSRAISLVDKVVKSSGSPAYYTFFRRPKTTGAIESYGKERTLLDLMEME